MHHNRVEEEDLNSAPFDCCGDEDLYPFKCSRCGRVMVFCYECDTLYGEPRDLSRRGWEVNHFEAGKPIFSCPGCGHGFEYYFMRNPRYHVTAEEWAAAGLGHLLREA